MIASFLIVFRETLEAALVVGIALGYLSRIRQTKYNRTVYGGVLAGVVASLVGALLFTKLAGGFTGPAEPIFEGVTMLIGALLLTTMILWMMRQRHMAKELEERMATEVAGANRLGLFSLVFISVLREGIETVIFLGAASLGSTENNLMGALVGLAAAILLGYVIFAGSRKVNLKTFFNITSVFLVLFAAGLVLRGIHELEEAHIVPALIEHVWDINPPLNPDGSYPLLHEDGQIGGILKSLFGYTGSPSLTEILGYLLYVAGVFLAWRRGGRAQESRGIKT